MHANAEILHLGRPPTHTGRLSAVLSQSVSQTSWLAGTAGWLAQLARLSGKIKQAAPRDINLIVVEEVEM